VVEVLEEIVFEGYKFSEFSILDDTTVRFKVTSNFIDFTKDDVIYIEDIIKNNLGKWESLIKTGLHIFSELHIIQPEQAVLQNYEKPFGIELYKSPSVEIDGLHDCLWVFISLTPEERRKRQSANVTPILQVEEIKRQISNIPKWKAFEKTIKIAKEQWLKV